jgi:hypothetical protein
MFKLTKKIIGYIFLLLIFYAHAIAQNKKKENYVYFNPLQYDGMLLNADMNISSFNYTDYLNFLPKLLDSDQFYRKQVKAMTRKDSLTKSQEIVDRMERNDRTNEIILLKLIKKFGWPCSKNLEDSFTAWIVVWHADTYTKNAFYPYMKEALKKGCILKAHYDQFYIE